MIGIIVNDSNRIFRFGLEVFLRKYFKDKFRQVVFFRDAVTKDNLRNADIIFLPVRKGEQYLCAPQFFLDSTAVIICITDEKIEPQIGLPECFRTAIWISRRNSLQELEEKITLAWTRVIYRKQISLSNKCSLCKVVKVTIKQETFLQLMNKGHSLEVIRNRMDMENKIFSSFKQQIKMKFCLKTDYDLLHFSAVFMKNATDNSQ